MSKTIDLWDSKMKAYIAHLFTVCGGGERVSLEMARVLREHGVEVSYVTNTSSGLRKCSEILGLPSDYDAIEISSLAEKLLSRTGRLVRLRRLILVSKAIETVSDGRDGLIIDTASNMPSSSDLSYIHYPAVLGSYESSSIAWRLYNWIVKKTAKQVFGRPRLLLANSSWTAGLVKRLFNLDANVLYPPVDVDYFRYDNRPKERIIMTVSRLTPEKSLHALPAIASRLWSYEWYLVGTTGSGPEERVSRRVLVEIKREVEKHNARNFHIALNIPREELRDLLRRSMFYVHPPFTEHFGIAVVEAMSAGVIPIVYSDGGAWFDIVKPISDQLGYKRVEEIPGIISKISEEMARLDEMREKIVGYANRFSVDTFRRRFSEFIDKIISDQRYIN